MNQVVSYPLFTMSQVTQELFVVRHDRILTKHTQLLPTVNQYMKPRYHQVHRTWTRCMMVQLVSTKSMILTGTYYMTTTATFQAYTLIQQICTHHTFRFSLKLKKKKTSEAMQKSRFVVCLLFVKKEIMQLLRLF